MEAFLFLTHTTPPTHTYTHTCMHSDSEICVTEDTHAKGLAPEQPQPGGATVTVVENRLSL